MGRKFANSIRIAYENWESEKRFDDIINLLRKHPCGITQVALFSASTHTPLKPDELLRRAKIMKERMAKLREAGFSAGINILATIGHHEEDLKNTVMGMGYTNMTDCSGNVCKGSFCVNDKKYINEYVIPAYKTLVAAEPEFIWVDDDIRLNHFGIESGCFCDNCIDRYNREHSTDYTRERVKDLIHSDNIDFRVSWLKHMTASISDILRTIGDTVRSGNDRITLGYMTGELFLEGNDFKAFSEALSSDGKYEIMWRPGGGAYDDFDFESGIMEKANEIGRQNAYLPSYVTVIQSEIENFPYQTTKKTPKSTAAEAMLHMQSGCSGAAFNILPSESDEPVASIENHLRKINAYVPLYNEFAEAVADMKITGVHNSWHIHTQAITPEGQWFRDNSSKYTTYNREMYVNGLPQAYNINDSEVVILNADNARLYSDGELIGILRGGVYMDGEAMKYLASRGLGKYIGFEAGREFEVDCIEQYTDTALNDGFAGLMRNCHQAFHPCTAYELIPTGEHINLAHLLDYDKQIVADCCMGIYENELGGRVCVAGYFPFDWVSDISKTTQLKRLFRYLSKDTLTAFVKTYCRARLINYTDGKNVVASLFNSTNDELENVEIAIRTDAQTCELCRNDGTKTSIKCTETDGVYKIFEIDKLGAYDFCFLKTK